LERERATRSIVAIDEIIDAACSYRSHFWKVKNPG
jgi:hypothetical protein